MSRSIILSAILFLFFGNCREKEESIKPTLGVDESLVEYESEMYFREAERLLAQNKRSAAARSLHKGVVAFRMETGSYHGIEAISANHAIDGLTKMRRDLSSGRPVDPRQLHVVIAVALDLEPGASRSNKHPGAVPVRPVGQ